MPKPRPPRSRATGPNAYRLSELVFHQMIDELTEVAHTDAWTDELWYYVHGYVMAMSSTLGNADMPAELKNDAVICKVKELFVEVCQMHNVLANTLAGQRQFWYTVRRQH